MSSKRDTISGLEGEGDGELEGLLPEGAGDAAGAAPGRALSTPCSFTEGQQGQRQGRAGQGRTGQTGHQRRGEQKGRANKCISFLVCLCLRCDPVFFLAKKGGKRSNTNS